MTTSVWRRLNARRDHRWAGPRVSAYLDGDLSDAEMRRHEQHREVCPECAQVTATLATLLELMPALRLPPESSFAIAERTAEEVRARLSEWA